VDADDGATGAVVDQDMVYEAAQEAADQIVLTAPRHLLSGMATDLTTDADTESTATVNRVIIPLPSDFLRLLALQVTDWTRPVYHEDVEVVGGDNYVDVVRDPDLRSVNRPRVFQVYSANSTTEYTSGSSAFDCYPGTTESTKVTSFVYVPSIAPELFDAALTEALLWLSVYYAFYAIDPETSALAMQRYRGIMRVRGMRRTVTGTRRLAAM